MPYPVPPTRLQVTANKGRVLAGAALFAGLGWLSGWAQPVLDLEKVRARAEQADVEAQNALGAAYNEGQAGLKQDYAEAYRWFRRAADKGFAPAQYNLGLAYDQGHGVAADEQQAFKLYLMAAEQGFAAAQFNVGNMYAAGRGVGQDLFEANLWFKQAAEQGVVEAQFNLGIAYETGKGVKKDEAQAARWYKLAADLGYPAAQYNLGLLFDDGRGVTKNEATAAVFYRAAAEQGFAPAQNNYGIMLSEGQGGLTKDPVQAWVWLSLAVQNGVSPSGRDFVARGLSADQRATAARLLAEHRSSKTHSSETTQRLGVQKNRLQLQPAPADDTSNLIEQLRAQSARLAAQVQSLTTDKEAAERQVAVLSVQVRDAQQDQARTQAVAPAVDVTRYESQVADLSARLEQATASLADLRAANQQLTEGNARLQQENEALAAKPGAPAPGGEQSAILATLQRDNARLNDEVKRSTRELLSLNSQLRALRNQAAKPAVEDTAAKQQIAQLTAKAEQATQEAIRWQTESSRLAARVTELENQPKPAAADGGGAGLAEAQQLAARLSEQVTSLQAEKAELEKWSRTLEQTVNEKSVVADGASSGLAELREKFTAAQQQLEAATAENRALAARVTQAEQALAAVPAPVKPDTSALDALRRQLAETQQQAEKLALEKQALADRVEGERLTLTQAQTRLVALERELSQARNSAVDRAELEELKSELIVSNQLLKKSGATVADLTGVNDRLQKELAAQSDEAARVRQDVAALRKANEVARQSSAETAALREENARLAQTVNEKSVLAEGASSGFAEFREKFTAAQQQLEAATAENRALAARVTQAEQALAAVPAPVKPDTSALDALRRQLAETQQQAEKLALEKQALEDRVDGERRTLAQAQARVAALERDLSEARKPAANSAELEDLKKQLIVSNQLLEKSGATVAELTGANDRLEKDLAARSAEATRFRQEAAALTKAKEDARQDSAETAALREELGKLRGEAAALAGLREENARLTQSATEAATLRSANEQLTRDSEQLAAFMNGNRRDLTAAQARVTELEQQLAAAKTSDNRGGGDTRKLATDLAEANAAVDRLNATVAELTGANERLELDLANAKKSTEAALAAQSQAVNATGPDAYRMEISTLQAWVKELEKQMEEDRNNSAREVSTLAAQLTRTRETNKSLTEANRALLSAKQSESPVVDKEEFDAVQARVRELAAAGEELKRQNQKLTADNEGLTAERSTLRQQLDESRQVATSLPGLTNENTALQERLEAVGAQLVKAQQEIDTLQKGNADAAAVAAAHQAAADQARADLAALQGRAAEAEKASESHNTSVAELTQANTRLEREREDMRRLVESYRADITRLTQNLRSAEQLRTEAERGAQQNVDAVTAQLGQLRRDLETARTAQARLVEASALQDRDRVAIITQLRTENGALAARLNQAQSTLDQIASAARLGTPAAAIAAGGPAPSRPVVTAPVAATEVRLHTVAEGDSLSRISMRYYGTANRWQEIFQANRDVLQGSSTLRIGMQLRIP